MYKYVDAAMKTLELCRMIWNMAFASYPVAERRFVFMRAD